MLDDDHRADLDGFVVDLKRVWRAVGGPSYAQLEYLSEKVLRQRRSGDVRFVSLAPSTTSEILNGRRKQALKWPWVLTFLTVLQLAAQQGAIDAAVVGTIDEWKLKHEAVLAAGQVSLRPAPASGTAPCDTPGGADALPEAFLAMGQRASLLRGEYDRPDIAPEWLELLYLTLQSGAQSIRTYEAKVIPGLLQTGAYAQAVTGQYPPSTTVGETSPIVQLRMQRQWLHRHQQRCVLWAVIEEAAFRGRQVDPRTMRAQIEYLIDLADEPDVSLQIVPAGIEGNLTLSEPVTIFRFPSRSLGDLVCLEQPDRTLFLHERKDTDHYNQLFDSLAIRASRPSITRRELIRIRNGI